MQLLQITLSLNPLRFYESAYRNSMPPIYIRSQKSLLSGIMLLENLLLYFLLKEETAVTIQSKLQQRKKKKKEKKEQHRLQENPVNYTYDSISPLFSL